MSKFVKPTITNFADYGKKRYIDTYKPNSLFPSTCNPSIVYNKEEDTYYLNIRRTSYILHASKSEYNPGGHWGPLIYSISSKRGNLLETENAICKLKDPMKDPFNYIEVDKLPHKGQWEFRGLEDIRLSYWNNSIYASPVVRDDNTTGIGRIHALKLKGGKIVKDTKLSVLNNEYCVKNLMPVEDRAFTYVYSTNPMVVVTYDETGKIVNKIQHDKLDIEQWKEFDMLRGSTQAVPFEDGYAFIVHSCQMWYTPNHRKDARYMHCAVYTDKEFNIKKVSPMFTFEDFPVEFCCGLTINNDKVYITYALQDNVSYILEVTRDTFSALLNNQLEPIKGMNQMSFNEMLDKGYQLFKKKDFSGAYTWFCKAVDIYGMYEARFWMARCISEFGERDLYERNLWSRVVEYDANRPEGNMALAMYFYCRWDYALAYLFGKKAMDNMDRFTGIYYSKDAMYNLWNNIQQQNGAGKGQWNKAF